MPGRDEPTTVTEGGIGSDESGDHPTEESGRADGTDAPRTRPIVSADGAYALLWGVVSLLAAALSFDGSVDLVVALAGFAGAVGVYAVASDLRYGRPPSGLAYLWMGTPALLAAGIAALDGRLLSAGGLGVVAVATLIEGYGWFGAGEDGDGRSDADRDGTTDPNDEA